MPINNVLLCIDWLQTCFIAVGTGISCLFFFLDFFFHGGGLAAYFFQFMSESAQMHSWFMILLHLQVSRNSQLFLHHTAEIHVDSRGSTLTNALHV